MICLLAGSAGLFHLFGIDVLYAGLLLWHLILFILKLLLCDVLIDFCEWFLGLVSAVGFRGFGWASVFSLFLYRFTDG